MTEKPKWGTDEFWRQHAIFGTDFSKPPHELIEEIRCKLSHLRGQLHDIGAGYSGFKESLENAQGSLTLIVSYLYGVMNDMEKVKEHLKPKEKVDS